MRKLVVSCDGTWNTADQEAEHLPSPTNVVKLHNCLAGEVGEVEQLRYYHPGVGTAGGLFDRLAGGMIGTGISRNIQSAYHWLARNYASDRDEIYLFGFSRGAYTVRSLAGMLGRCGLLELGSRVSTAEGWERVRIAYEAGYRKKQKEWAKGDWPFHHQRLTPIRFLGVWDTVGALGIPNDLALLNLFDRPRKWMFHDTTLGQNVQTARHAVGLDEIRASYTPTLWTNRHPDLAQLWFPGVHSDVGGGYPETGLSDIALQWMIDEARAAGLGFRDEMARQIHPDPQDVLHHSYRGVFKALRTQPRPIPLIRSGSKQVHRSAVDRQAAPPITQAPYHPTRRLQGTPLTVDVFAHQRWNDTGLYLERGTYKLTARGEWLDKNVPCGPAGMRDGKFHLGEIAHLLSGAVGRVEELLARSRRFEDADLKLTRRHEGVPWFALTGVVAHRLPKPKPDGTPSSYRHFEIGDGVAKLEVKQPGYLLAYANDAWDFYDNNRGSVQLTVERLSS